MGFKNSSEILSKLGIKDLNQMQKEVHSVYGTIEDLIVLSPTGSGKTIAFLLPLIESLDPNCEEVQALIVVPSRELALQIELVLREMGSGFKANAIYGGRPGAKDKVDLQQAPSILIGTPGRLSDHMLRGSFKLNHIKTLVLDEFDKSLEIGFEKEMKSIIWELPQVQKRIFTSATATENFPKFLSLRDPMIVNHLSDGVKDLKVKVIASPDKDKLDSLCKLLSHLSPQSGIVFCNFKESIERVSAYLTQRGISASTFYGGLDQRDRERALIKFRNGTSKVLLATDLAARGIDVPELKFIIHYHLPLKSEEFIHRNGRTARMHEKGTAYVLKGSAEELPSFIKEEYISISEIPTLELEEKEWLTLFISGGRKDKISKGDLVGMFLKEGNLSADDLGVIELKQDCAFVGVSKSKATQAIQSLNNYKLKKKKVRISAIE